jgi:hypothetical protein
MLKKVSQPVDAVSVYVTCNFEWRRESNVRDRMKSTEQNVIVELPKLADPATLVSLGRTAPELGAVASLQLHWPEYLMEGGLLGAFMMSACLFGIIYGYPGSPVRQAISSSFIRGLARWDLDGRYCALHLLLAMGKTVRSTHQSIGDACIPAPRENPQMGRHLLYSGAVLRRCVWSLISC